jgi:hypothetical protein
MRHTSPSYTLQPYYLKIRFNIILSSNALDF